MDIYYLKNDAHYGDNYSYFLRMGAASDAIFSDKTRDRKKSGSDYNRIKALRQLDSITVPTLSTLGDTAREMYAEISWFLERSVSIRILEIPDSVDPKYTAVTNRTLRDTYRILAHREHERQQERSHDRGRKPLPYPENWDSLYKQWKNKEIPARKVLEETGLKRSSFYKLVKRYEESNHSME